MKVIYRHYATLYFVFVVDSSESELGILDLIQVCCFMRDPARAFACPLRECGWVGSEMALNTEQSACE